MQGEGCAGPPACPAAAARPVSPEPQKIPAAAAKAGRGRGGGSRGRRRGRRGAGEGEAGEGMGLAARQHRHPAALAWSRSHGGRQPRPPSCCHPSHPAWGGCGQRCPQHRHITTGPGPKVPWGQDVPCPLATVPQTGSFWVIHCCHSGPHRTHVPVCPQPLGPHSPQRHHHVPPT